MNSTIPARTLTARPYTAEFHEKAVTRVIQLLRSNPNRTWTVKDMARAAFMSPYHFIRVFQEVAGIAPCKFQWALKLHTAKQLLLLTNLPILAISKEVGYNSLGTFTRRFSQLVGLSPSRFRHCAKTTHSADLQRAMDAYEPPPSAESTLTGRVYPPARFRGTIVLACFPSRFPQGQPLHNAVVDSACRFCVHRPPLGDFYLHAFGIPRSDTNTAWFTDENLLRAAIACSASGDAHLPQELFLRGVQPIDPPVLVAMATLIGKRLSAQIGEQFVDPQRAVSLPARAHRYLSHSVGC
jgi:AraC family transcriptional regulator